MVRWHMPLGTFFAREPPSSWKWTATAAGSRVAGRWEHNNQPSGRDVVRGSCVAGQGPNPDHAKAQPHRDQTQLDYRLRMDVKLVVMMELRPCGRIMVVPVQFGEVPQLAWFRLPSSCCTHVHTGFELIVDRLDPAVTHTEAETSDSTPGSVAPHGEHHDLLSTL